MTVLDISAIFLGMDRSTSQSDERIVKVPFRLSLIRRMDEAIELFRRAIELQPNAEDAKRNLAMAIQVKRKD